MAAVLKKRALAEYSQVIQDEPPKVKKLRLSKKIKSGSTEIDLSVLSETSSSHDVMQIILLLGDALPLQFDDAQSALRRLLDHCHKELETAVRVKIIKLIAEILKTSNIDGSSVFDDLVSLLRVESSHKVITQLLDTLLQINQNVVPSDGKLVQKLLTLSKQFLTDTNHQVKIKCLQLISELTPVDTPSENSNSSMKILGEYCHSQDPRVRSAAFGAMLQLHERGLKLDETVYSEVCTALSDNYEGVRAKALKLIRVIGQTYPENFVPVADSMEEIRLVDDAFAKICNAMNDLSVAVRTQAAELLGSFTTVSQRFLEQTLDKKLMSHLRRKRSAHERQKENYQSGEWSTGQKWADDAPKEVMDTDSISLMNSGACGAFVHGLEDEFLEVRTATVNSLGHLALSFPNFAIQSIDFLVDMFNDEIEDVRVQAIRNLCIISKHISLREDQLETILAVLEDFSMEIREGLHHMLGSCHLSTKACLKMCIDHLLENLKRYPQDKHSIRQCLQKLGGKHPELTLPLVPELLGIHPYLDMLEPDMDDPTYISILILVFNAAANCPTMMPLFEQHTLRHYLYLQDSLPDLVPHLKISNQTHIKPDSIEYDTENTRSFLHQILERVATAYQSTPVSRQTLMETAIKDLQRLSEIAPNLSAAANCASLYIRCQSLFMKVLSNKNWSSPSLLALQQGYTVKNTVEKVLQLSFQLRHKFLGLNPSELATIHQMRLRALALQLVYIVCGSNSSALALCEHFLDQVDHLQQFLLSNRLEPDTFTASVFHEMDRLDEPKPGAVARLLQPILQLHDSPVLRLTSDVLQAKATIFEPTGESENVLKFTSGLVLGVQLNAEIWNVKDLKTVKIRVKYPDQQIHLLLPRINDYREASSLSPLHRRLITTVLISHNIWSEACHVEISLVMDFSDSESSSSGGARQKSASTSTANKTGDEMTIELCKPVKVYVLPKPIKKGI